MTTTDEERPSAALEVVLGVDTHLDVCTWAWPWTTMAGTWVR
jgi:hypothetical protein